MSSTVFSTALSGVAAAQTHLDTSAHNLANGQTPGFKRQFVQQTAQPTGGVTTTIQTAPTAGHAMVKDIITQLSGSYSYKANMKVVEVASDMSGTLLDLRA